MPDGERWDHNAIAEVLARPRRPDPRKLRHTREQVQQAADRAAAEAASGEAAAASGANLQSERIAPDEAPKKRDFKITQRVLDHCGTTENCPGCRQARRPGAARRSHTARCRQRMEEELSKTPEGRRILHHRDVRHGLVQDEDELGDEDLIRIIEEEEGQGDVPERGVESSASKEDIRGREIPEPRGVPRTRDEEEPTRRSRARVEPRRGQIRPRHDSDADSEESDEPPRRSRRVGALEKFIANVISVNVEYARKRGLDPMEKSTRPVVKKVLQDLNQKHARKLKRYEDRAKNDRYREKAPTRSVAEAYSPPRLVQVAEEFGLRGAWSLDLTLEDRDDGAPLDFNVSEKREKAVRLLHKDRPDMLMLGPNCAPFCTLNQWWNYPTMPVRDMESSIAGGMRHLAFSVHLALHQARAGRYFAVEHPVGAASWHTETLSILRGIPGVVEVEFDFCMLGMTSVDEQGEAPAKKRTRIATNCPELARALRRYQCSGDHRHVRLVQGASVEMPRIPDSLLPDGVQMHGPANRLRPQEAQREAAQEGRHHIDLQCSRGLFGWRGG